MQIRQPTLSIALLTMFAGLIAAAPAAAHTASIPTIHVTPGVLVAESQAKISYSNPALAGQTVTIDVSDSTRGGTPTAIEITLDANGDGLLLWSVPNWFGATFNAPGCAELFVPIQ